MLNSLGAAATPSAIGGGEEVLGGAAGVVQVTLRQVRAANPDATNLRRLLLNIRHARHALFRDELHPHAG